MKQNWISIQDHLPAQQQVCLVSISHYQTASQPLTALGEEVALADYIPPYKPGSKFIFLTHSNHKDMDNVIFNNAEVTKADGDIISKITAWMPLPEPYIEA
jgi:hypothetical protein